eukprot:1183034-Prorocentrum_minimum.AAC.4
MTNMYCSYVTSWGPRAAPGNHEQVADEALHECPLAAAQNHFARAWRARLLQRYPVAAGEDAFSACGSHASIHWNQAIDVFELPCPVGVLRLREQTRGAVR